MEQLRKDESARIFCALGAHGILRVRNRFGRDMFIWNATRFHEVCFSFLKCSIRFQTISAYSWSGRYL